MEIIRIALFILSMLLFYVVAEKGATKRTFATSIADMEALPLMEKVMIKSFKKYITELNSKLNITKSALKVMKSENVDDLKNVASRQETPLRRYKLIRRLHADWPHWLDYLDEPIGKEFVDAMNKTLKEGPTLNDVQEAAKGLQRIQVVYNLHIDDMAKGKLNKWRNSSSKLSAWDLNAIGKLLFMAGARANALNWLESSLRPKFDKELYLEVFRTSIKRFYYDYKRVAMKLNGSFKKLNEIQAVSRGSYEPLKIKSHDDPLVENLNFKMAMLESESKIKPVLKAYKRTCRGLRRNTNYMNTQTCYYKRDTPFLKIAPNKVEIQSPEPIIVLLYDVISDRHIAELKNMSKYHMTRSKTFDGTEIKARTAKTFVIGSSESGGFNLKRWQNRLKSILGFNFVGVENPEVINYGIGGHHGLHFDTMEKSMEEANFGKRHISMILYLSDVEQGGATIFPLLDLSIAPRKGAVLLWLNGNNGGGLPDWRTMHASCPVIRGSKWIMPRLRGSSKTRLDRLHILFTRITSFYMTIFCLFQL